MSHQPRPGRQRTGPVFGVVLVVVGAVAALTPAVPGARAVDPTPEPSPTVSLVPEPTPEPTAAPTPEPSVAPDPVASPSASEAPQPTPTDAPVPDPVASPTVSPDPSSSPDAPPSVTEVPPPTPTPTPEPEPAVAHSWIETVNPRGTVVARGRLDEALADAARFTVYRVRFQVVNASDTDHEIEPVLQVSGVSVAWRTVPEADPVAGVPFYAASDNGTTFKGRAAAIEPTALRLQGDGDPTASAVRGVSSSGRNPLASTALPAHSYTEIEFAVRATVDAAWKTEYTFRLLDGATELVAAIRPVIVMGAKPALKLSPGQRTGRDVADPIPRYALDMAGVDGSGGELAIRATTAGLRLPLAGPTSFSSPHADYSLTSSACAECHATHTAQGGFLTADGSSSGLCFRCHDGSGSSFDVEAQFTSSSVPENDPSTSSWYAHPATEAPSPTTADPPFEGVLNRRAQCADCHQPHASDGTRPVGTTSGWTAAGAIRGAAGVSVANGAAGTAPTYVLNTSSALEYELCFKCHSGYTQLPAQDPAHPSRWALDKGIELNPANLSYHPVEAPGRNQTTAMARSLSGTSPSKLWSFETTSTIRCQNCHGDSDVANPASPPTANARLDNHAGPNRGILIAPYRDRDLLTSLETYDARDFSLCYVCHAEPAMVDGTGDVRTDTNFNWHGLHLNEIWLNGTGPLDIDVAGAGQGNAVCAECHFRIHGTALAVGGQAPAKGLVNFAPVVQPVNGVLEFRAWTPGGGPGSCTLTCHGRPHNAFTYEGVP